jgi:sugar phosphate isomerase/epimerase
MIQNTTPAIWTAMYAELPLHEALTTLADQGWSGFELSTEHFCELEAAPDAEREIDLALEVCQQRGLSMPQGHALLQANVAHPDLARRATDMERLKRHLHLAEKLNVRIVVVHPGMVESSTTREERRLSLTRNAEAFRELAEVAARCGCRLAIENMSRRGFCSSADMLELLDAIGSDTAGITFDSSHANMSPGIDIPAAVRDFGDRLLATHLSDNDGSGDQHRTPGNGGIHWRELMQALSAIGYAGLVNLEIPGERHPVLALRALKSRHALRVAEWLMEQARA